MKLNKKYLLSFFVIFIFLAALISAIFLAQQPQETRRKAATPSGTTTVFLSPQNVAFSANQPNSIDIYFNTADQLIDGVQIIINLEASPSATFSNPKLEVASIPGLKPEIQNIEPNVIELIVVTSDQLIPYTTRDKDIKLATITFTPQTTGTINLNFVPELTKIAENQTTQDILLTPQNGNYTIINPQKETCNQYAGQWKQFPTTCSTDSCAIIESEIKDQPIICTSVLTYSCDCGPDSCWDGSVCAPNPTPPPPLTPNCTTPKSSMDSYSGRTPFLVGFNPGGEPPATASGIMSYQWDYDADGTWDEEVSFLSATHTYTKPGIYNPVFRVRGLNNLDSQICSYPFTISVHYQTDTNQDGIVDITDYSLLVAKFLQTGDNLDTDFNQDGIVDISDYSIFVSEFLKSI